MSPARLFRSVTIGTTVILTVYFLLGSRRLFPPGRVGQAASGRSCSSASASAEAASGSAG